MMDVSQALSATLATVVASEDVADALLQVVTSCAATYPADAVAILARNGSGTMELLSSDSHRADRLELLQIQHRLGPCVDAMEADTPVLVAGRDELVARWDAVGSAIADTGFETVHAFPMHWRGTTLGGLNIFIRSGDPADSSIGQLFADLATLAVVRPDGLSSDQLVARVHAAVEARAVVEQAKGVLAYHLKIDMDAAHTELLTRARAAEIGVTAMARQVIDDQYRPNT